jgi:hypothetical protein
MGQGLVASKGGTFCSTSHPGRTLEPTHLPVEIVGTDPIANLGLMLTLNTHLSLFCTMYESSLCNV